jgi:hypothetical protein
MIVLKTSVKNLYLFNHQKFQIFLYVYSEFRLETIISLRRN